MQLELLREYRFDPTSWREPRGGVMPRLSISFSGGKTSGYMLFLLLNQYSATREIVVTFCNTSREHPETLEFVRKCGEFFSVEIIWLEAVVHHESRDACTHRVVTHETAKRDGEVFEEVIKKYGIANPSYLHCNREMKLNVMKSYYESIGWKMGEYSIAVGIRWDEMTRISIAGMARGIFYPCIDNRITKEHVREFWVTQPFNLGIPEHYGNCIDCYKKTTRKLLTIARDDPSHFEFTARMERDYSTTGASQDGKPRRPFRGNLTTADILAMSRKPFIPFVDGRFTPFDDDLDVGGGCGDSCEIGADENDAIMNENWSIKQTHNESP